MVGQRIVLRHRLADGRASDVLGVCLRWGRDSVLLDTERGVVAVALTTIVTGKPVPPRASVRQRVPAAVAGRHVLALWPVATSSPLGDWVLRDDVTFALGDPGLDLPRAAEQVIAFHRQHRGEPVAQVEAGSAADHEFARRGWVPGPETHFQVASLSRALRACQTSGVLESRLTESANHLTVEVGAATGRAILAGDWLGLDLHGLTLHSAHPAPDADLAVLDELLDWGGSLGATTAWLHVAADDLALLGMVRRLGFVTHHTTRLRRAG